MLSPFFLSGPARCYSRRTLLSTHSEPQVVSFCFVGWPRFSGIEPGDMIRLLNFDRISSLDRSYTDIIMAPPSIRPKMGHPSLRSTVKGWCVVPRPKSQIISALFFTTYDFAVLKMGQTPHPLEKNGFPLDMLMANLVNGISPSLHYILLVGGRSPRACCTILL